ncbi:hypothetical protein B296_00058989, partial [Ensete ventricosum]
DRNGGWTLRTLPDPVLPPPSPSPSRSFSFTSFEKQLQSPAVAAVAVVVEMEIRGGRGRRLSSREVSPERARLGCSQQQRLIRCLRKVQVIYYLSRNGQLEQPHFIELPHLPNHQLRLREDHDEEEAAEEEVTEEEEELRGGKGMGGDKHPNGAGYSRLSRGVSTDEIERVAVPANHHGLPQLPTDDSSPPSSTTSDKPPGRGASRRFEEVDQTPEPGLTRNSVLLQLIACGAAALKGRSSPSGGMIKAAATSASPVEERRSNVRHRGVVSRLASRAGEEDELRRDWDNPRFCHPLIEDKEYFSGSIVEGIRGPSEPSLKKSSSYNEER